MTYFISIWENKSAYMIKYIVLKFLISHCCSKSWSNCWIHYFYGYHDFLIGAFYTTSGMEILQKKSVM